MILPELSVSIAMYFGGSSMRSKDFRFHTGRLKPEGHAEGCFNGLRKHRRLSAAPMRSSARLKSTTSTRQRRRSRDLAASSHCPSSQFQTHAGKAISWIRKVIRLESSRSTRTPDKLHQSRYLRVTAFRSSAISGGPLSLPPPSSGIKVVF